MPSGKTQVAATVAVLALSLGSTSAAPTFDSDMELAARSGIGSKVVGIGARVGKDIAQNVGTSEMNKKINSYVNPPHNVHPGLVEAGKKATAGHNHKVVSAALGHVKKHKRDLDFEDVLEARSGIGSKVIGVGARVGKDIAQSVGTGEMNKKINSYVNPPHKVHPGLVNAARKATAGHNPKVVSAALGHLKKHKRDLDFDNDLFERDFDFEDELEARSIGSKITRVGGNLAKEYAQNVGSSEMHKKINSYVNPPLRVHPGLVDAARKATAPHDPRLVAAAVGHLKKHKRDLDFEDDLFERDFDFEDDLEARSGIGSKVVGIGARVGKDIAQSVGTSEMNKKINSYVNPPHRVHPGLVEASRRATAHHDPKLVSAAIAHTRIHKRDIEELVDFLVTRAMELEFDDLE